MNEFTISIMMGNDAMRTPADVAKQLRHVASELEDGFEAGTIRDDNGNNVGHFATSEYEFLNVDEGNEK